MPKRSNDFQKLILFIEQQLAAENAVVRESVMLTPLDGGEDLEVDVLIEAALGRHRLLLAIECRDHRRPATKEWINELVGKYAVLPVDKVIAVSRSGFTRGAKQRAVGGKVVLSTMRAVRETDWPSTLRGWRLALIDLTPRPRAVSISYRGESPPFEGNAFANARICDIHGQEISTVIADARYLFETHARRRLGEWLGTEKELWTRVGDQDLWTVTLDFQAHGRYVRGPDGRLHQIDKLFVEVECQVELRKPDPSFYEYEGTMVSTFTEERDGNRTSFSVILDPNTGSPSSFQARAAADNTRDLVKKKRARLPNGAA